MSAEHVTRRFPIAGLAMTSTFVAMLLAAVVTESGMIRAFAVLVAVGAALVGGRDYLRFWSGRSERTN